MDEKEMVMDDQPKSEDKQVQPAASEEKQAAVVEDNDDDLAYLDKDEQEDEEVEASDDSDESEKLYTKKQLDRQLEKRVKKERRNIDKRIEDRVNEELAKLRSEFGQTQRAPSQNDMSYESQADDDDWSNLSPQEYAKKVIDHERRERERLSQQEQAAREQAEQYNQIMRTGREKFEDFDEVMETAKFTPTIAQAAQLHDNTDEILYYFAHNEDKTLDLANKSPIEQAREVNRIAMRLATRSKTVKTTEAPRPGETRKSDTTSRGNAGYVQSLKSSMSIRELANLRKG